MNRGLRFLLIQQRHAAHIPPEGMEVGPGQTASLKERLCRCQHSGQIPGDEIQIPTIQTSGPAQEGHGFRSCLPQDGLPQVVPEIQHGLAPLLTGKTGQGIAEEAGRDAVPVVFIHQITVGAHIVVDEHRQAAASSIDIQPPVGVGVLHRFQLISKITVFQIVAAVPPEGKAHGVQQLRQFGKEHGRFVFRLSININPSNKGDCGNFSDGLIHQHREGPPHPVGVLLQKALQLLTGKNQVHLLIVGGIHPHLDILGPDFEVPGPQHKALTGLAAHPDNPVFQHRCRCLLLEIHQRKQAGPKTLRAENQFIHFAIES